MIQLKSFVFHVNHTAPNPIIFTFDDMLRRFKQFVTSRALFSAGDRILIAVSGGVDSVVLCRLMHDAEYEFGIAHCNFMLRGKESDADEEFVESLAARFNVPFFVKHFETKKIAREQGLSVQMAARKLRYDWFEELRQNEGFRFVATAHHLNDQAETFFINLLRGTGLAGLHGILPLQGNLIRPLLFATRDEISEFAHFQHLEWREDSSNANTKYLRNQIRLELMPVLEKLDPGFVTNLEGTIQRLRGIESVYKQKIEEGRLDLVEHNNVTDRILINYLEEFEPIETWLFELLRPYGFSESVTREIAQSLEGTESKVFYSLSHRVVRDRDYLVIEDLEKIPESTDCEFLVHNTVNGIETSAPVPITFRCEKAQGFVLPDKQSTGCFDFDKLQFPLILRHWREGDWMVPLGMKGRKKLSDIFIDQKLTQSEKTNIWILCSGNDIVWLSGLRTDSRFSITTRTKNILLAEMIEPADASGNSSCWLFK
jgi:tRNA(Ile)-lysidine synthase